MTINLKNKLSLVTYNKDSICIKKGNETIASANNIISVLNCIDKNEFESVKNRVQRALKDLSNIDMTKVPNELETENYRIEFDNIREFCLLDLTAKNNKRWFYDKDKVIKRIYDLEINRINAFSIDELIEKIELFNTSFLEGLK